MGRNVANACIHRLEPVSQLMDPQLFQPDTEGSLRIDWDKEGSDACLGGKTAPAQHAAPPRQKAIEVAQSLSALKKFPNSDAAVQAIARQLHRMARTDQELEWIEETMLAQFDEWPGPKTLRSVFCKKFAPADSREG